jgi:hypothetical protein
VTVARPRVEDVPRRTAAARLGLFIGATSAFAAVGIIGLAMWVGSSHTADDRADCGIDAAEIAALDAQIAAHFVEVVDLQSSRHLVCDDSAQLLHTDVAASAFNARRYPDGVIASLAAHGWRPGTLRGDIAGSYQPLCLDAPTESALRALLSTDGVTVIAAADGGTCP